MPLPDAETTMSDPMTLTRHFVTINQGRFGARQVHYRRAGRGPCLFLFHQSPMSSRDLLPVIERWKHQYTCIAPDTPGYGQSDPFGVDVIELDDIADAVIEFADAIGVGQFAAYGFHTGAGIAVATAAKFPDRVTCAVANGYVVPTEEARADLLAHYLPKFEPKWDGSHLTWLWARLREQTIFFPWYRPGLEMRMNFDVPPPEALQRGVVEFLRAGDNYRAAYRAAFAFRGDVALERAQVPVLVTANSFDPLHADLARIRRRGPKVISDRAGGI
jgi:pimeloyl-ACP methyl ester carboxylesterase